MKHAVALFSLVLVVGGMVGCAELTGAQQEELAKLVGENKALVGELDGLYAKLTDGTATVAEVMVGVNKIRSAIDKNLARINEIKEEGATTEGATTMAIIGGVVGTLFRTVLHGATKLPIGGPVGAGVQMLLGLLLGGSETKKKAPGTAPAG